MAVLTESVRHLRVLGPLYFGKYRRGTVMPRWAAELSGRSVGSMIEDGTFEWTDDPVVEEFVGPTMTSDDLKIDEEMIGDLNRTRRDNETLKLLNKGLDGENQSLREQNTAHIRTLGEHTAEISRLQTLLGENSKARGEAEKQSKELKQMLDESTKPEATANKPVVKGK